MQAASILSVSVAAAVTAGGSGIGSSSLMAFSNSIAGLLLPCSPARRRGRVATSTRSLKSILQSICNQALQTAAFSFFFVFSSGLIYQAAPPSPQFIAACYRRTRARGCDRTWRSAVLPLLSLNAVPPRPLAV